MNMKLIERIVASYNETLDESDKARLAFFQGMWEEMQRWMGGPVAAAQSYECPPDEVLLAAWNEDRPAFSYAPCSLSRDRLVAIFNALRTYVVDSGVLKQDDSVQLAELDSASLLTRELVEQAAQDPAAFLEAFAEVAQQACATAAKKTEKSTSVPDLLSASSSTTNESAPYAAANIAVLIAGLVLRVEFEPVAIELSKHFPRGDDCHHNPLHCPVCGSAPALARVGGDDSPTDGRGKSLYCQQCGCVWDFERIRCARCGTRNQGHLHYFNIEGDDGHRIATCDECGDYIRTIFIEEALRPFSFEVEEVVTARLDAIAHDPRFQAPKEDGR